MIEAALIISLLLNIWLIIRPTIEDAKLNALERIAVALEAINRSTDGKYQRP